MALTAPEVQENNPAVCWESKFRSPAPGQSFIQPRLGSGFSNSCLEGGMHDKEVGKSGIEWLGCSLDGE